MGSSRPSLDFLLEMTEPESRSGSPAGIDGDAGGPEDEDEDDDLTTVDEEEPTLAGEEQQSVASSTTTAAQPSKKVLSFSAAIISSIYDPISGGGGEPTVLVLSPYIPGFPAAKIDTKGERPVVDIKVES
ncbi:hypothetical protein quinque_005160 [Culex quinquefasciatus]